MESGEVRGCVGSVPSSSSRGEAMELGRRVTNMSTAPPEELQDGSSLMAEPFHKAQSCQTPALCSPPPKPTTGTEPPPRRGAVGQGRLNTTPASGFLRDKPLLALPRLTPSKSDFAEHQGGAGGVHGRVGWGRWCQAPQPGRGARGAWGKATALVELFY